MRTKSRIYEPFRGVICVSGPKNKMLLPLLINIMLLSLIVIFLLDIIFQIDKAKELEELIGESKEMDF